MHSLAYLYVLSCLFLHLHFQPCHGLPGRCTTDGDCPVGSVCITVEMGRSSVSKCTANTKSKPACRGRLFGHCPSPDAELGSVMCLFQKTNKIRNVKCCNDDLTSGLIPGDDEDKAKNGTLTSTSSSNAGSGSKRRLADDEEGCFECFPIPDTKKSVAGSYTCVLSSQCKEKSSYVAACDTGLTCDTGTDELCSFQGTCTPTDKDDPIKSFRCLCKPGFGGRFCDEVISNECVADCGIGGECVKGQCKCSKGYTLDQCFGCTGNTTCNIQKKAGYCNLETKKCACNPGFEGDKFCGKQSDPGDVCADVNCGEGAGTCLDGKCYCLNDCAGAECAECKKELCTDCNAASSLSSRRLVLVVFLASIFIIY